MDNNTQTRFEEIERKIDAIYSSAKKIEWYFKLTFIVTIIFFVAPLILSLFAVPYLISTYSSLYSGLQ